MVTTAVLVSTTPLEVLFLHSPALPSEFASKSPCLFLLSMMAIMVVNSVQAQQCTAEKVVLGRGLVAGVLMGVAEEVA